MKGSQGEQEQKKTGEVRGDKRICKRSLTCSRCGDQEVNYFTQASLSKDQKAHTCQKCQAKNWPPGFSQMNGARGMRMAGSKRPRDVPPTKRGKVEYLPVEKVKRLEQERAQPSVPSIFSSRPRQINPSVSTQPPKGTSKKTEFSSLNSPVKVNRSSYQGTSGPPKTSRDGSGLKRHRQAKQLLEDRRDETALVQQATRDVRRELPVEADPSVDAGAFASSRKGKFVDKGTSVDMVSPKRSPSGYLHKQKSSYPTDCVPAFEPGTADAAPAPEDPELILGKVEYLLVEKVKRLEQERAQPSVPSIFSSRPRQINPSVSTQPPKGTSKKTEFSSLNSPVKVNRSSYQGTSGPPKTSRDGSGLKRHRQAKQLLEDRRDETALVQQATRNVRRELPVEADPSVDAGAFGSSRKGKFVDKGTSVDMVSPKRSPSGYLHKRKFSYPTDCVPAFEPGTADAAPAPEDPELILGKVEYLLLEKVNRLEQERAQPSVPSIFSSRPRQINPSVSTQPPKGTSKKTEFSSLNSPVKVNRSSYQGTSGPPKTSRDGSGLKRHRQAKQLLEDRRDETALVQQATRDVRRELPVEADPSVDAGAFASSRKGKFVDKGTSVDMVSPKRSPSGYLHKRKFSYPTDCVPAFEPGTADAAPTPEDPELIRDLPYFPSSTPSWIGKFKFSGNPNVAEYYGAFKAYPTVSSDRRAYEFSVLIPEDLPAELIPECQQLIDSKMTSPKLSDIALYFYPDVKSDSSHKDYASLCGLMKDQDSAIRASIDDDVDLLIFTSKHLQFDTQWLKNDIFLWGVYSEAQRVPAPQNLSNEISTRVPSPKIQTRRSFSTKKDDYEPAMPKDDRTNSREEPDKNRGAKTKRSSGWRPPCADWVKLNTSAVSSGSMAGAGGSVHGPSGKWIVGYVFNAGQCDWTQLRADLWALIQGLKLVRDRGYKKVQVETDSEQARECLKNAPDESNPNADFIKTCRKLLLGDWQISQSHVSRERNRPAVLMANGFEQHNVGILTVVDTPPPGLAENTGISQEV